MRFQCTQLLRHFRHTCVLIPQCSFSKICPPRVAIVGSGPAGMFTCSSLLRRSNAVVDVFDAAPVPFGLIRYGVAPDHQEVKNCIHGFEKMFESSQDRLSLFCNVRIGSDLTYEELISEYDAVLLAYGAHRPRRLSIPGADASNIFSGSEFVSWYSGVPKSPKPLLDCNNVVIIGNGNVALDCARIICNGTNGQLRSTDIPVECIEELERSCINDIKIIGRRGPLHISFTVKELREQFRVSFWNTVASISEDDMKAMRQQLPNMTRQRSRLMKVLVDGGSGEYSNKNCHFLFNRLPQMIEKDLNGRVKAIRILNNEKNAEELLECGLLIYSIGYEIIVLDGIPKNSAGMIDMVDPFRVKTDSKEKALVYAGGWCAHGAKGVIVDSQLQSSIIAEEMAKDLASRKPTGRGAKHLLDSRNVTYLNWEQWKEIDKEERDLGEMKGKIREKLIQFDKYICH